MDADDVISHNLLGEADGVIEGGDEGDSDSPPLGGGPSLPLSSVGVTVAVPVGVAVGTPVAPTSVGAPVTGDPDGEADGDPVLGGLDASSPSGGGTGTN